MYRLVQKRCFLSLVYRDVPVRKLLKFNAKPLFFKLTLTIYEKYVIRGTPYIRRTRDVQAAEVYVQRRLPKSFHRQKFLLSTGGPAA